MSGWNPLLLLICIVLTAILAGFLIFNYQAETLERERLKAAAGREQAFYTEEEMDIPDETISYYV